MFKKFLIFVIVLIVGSVLGVIGTISFPIGSNMSYFWPAATIQSVAGLFFGFWGALAGTLFPSVSNALTDGSLSHIFGLIPANFVQSFCPLLVKRIFKLSPLEFNVRTVVIFVLGCAIIPHLIGGVVGCGILYWQGNIPDLQTFWQTFRVWIFGNIPCAVIFGLLLIKTVLPVINDCNLHYEY